jgi:hypothetical protein
MAFLLRRGGSNSRPTGYEPVELPLLYFAMLDGKGNRIMATFQRKNIPDNQNVFHGYTLYL